MKKLNSTYFPLASPNTKVKFKTKEGETHTGRYDFNETNARRWFDENDNQYTSDLIDEWEELEHHKNNFEYIKDNMSKEVMALLLAWVEDPNSCPYSINYYYEWLHDCTLDKQDDGVSLDDIAKKYLWHPTNDIDPNKDRGTVENNIKLFKGVDYEEVDE